MMKTKEEIIHSMFMTYRHDYGLRKLPNDPPWTAGMTEEDAKSLYKVMEQIYNNDIEPILKEKNDRKVIISIGCSFSIKLLTQLPKEGSVLLE